MRSSSIYPALRFLHEGDDFLLTSHVNSDGDGIGACLALQRMLRQMDKTSTVVLPGPPDRHFDFLAGWESIQQAASPPPRTHLWVVVVDCPHLSRVGDVQPYIAEQARILNVDHHLVNDAFGHVDLVSPDMSSVCEILYHLARVGHLQVDEEMATQLYAGIIFDTGGFRYSLTSADTLEAGADLVRRGARPDFIAERVLAERTLAEVQQLTQALESLELHLDGRVATLHLSHQQLRAGDPQDIVNFGLFIRNVQAAIFLKEEKSGEYRVSLRSRSHVDVSQVAAAFGGGGHFNASGCRMKGTREEVQTRLLEALQPHLN